MEKNHTVKCPISSKDIKTKSTQAFFYLRESGITAYPILQGHREISEAGCQKRIIFFPARGLIIWETGIKNKGPKSEFWLPHVLDGKPWMPGKGGGCVCYCFLAWGERGIAEGVA